MKTLLPWLLCSALGGASLLTPQVAHAAAAAAEDAADDDEIPEGCWKAWFCYKPPASEATHPDLEENKFKVYLASLFLGFPYIQWLVTDDGKIPYKDDDLVDQLKAAYLPLAFILPMYAVSYLMMLTIILFPLGYIGLLVTGGAAAAWYLYFAPITRIQLVNRTLMRDGGGGKPKGKALKKHKPDPTDED